MDYAGPKHESILHKVAVLDKPTQRTCISLGRLRASGSLSICLERGGCVSFDMVDNTKARGEQLKFGKVYT